MKRIIHIKDGFKVTTSIAGDDWAEPPDGSQMPEGDPRLEGMQWMPPPARDPIWPNAQAFMAAFTMPEKASIALSTDPTTAALRLELTTWLDTVDPSHELVQTGLNKLVEIGIISEDRKAEIIATASAN